jgi:hypothetical protein
MTAGGWKGKTQPHYTLSEAGLTKTAKDIFGTKDLLPSQIVKKVWDFVKANSTKVLVKTE